MDNDLVEESMDSIPRPEYEAIEGDDDSTESSNSHYTFSHDAITTTTTAISGQQELKKIILIQRVGAAGEAEAYDEDDAQELADKESNEKSKLLTPIGCESNSITNNKRVEELAPKEDEPDAAEVGAEEEEDEEDEDDEELADQEMHATSLRYIYDAEEEEQQHSAQDPHRIQKEAQRSTQQLAETEQAVSNAAATSTAKKIIIHYGGTTSVPKMLPAKIKDNKLVMVQMVETSDQFKALTPTMPTTPTDAVKIVNTAAPPQPRTPLVVVVPAPRSSTPLSREFLALQRSVNESKILSEFVTDTAAAADADSSTPSSSAKPSRKLRKTPAALMPVAAKEAVGLEKQKRPAAEIGEAHITAENSFLAITAAGSTSTPVISPPEKTRKHSSKFAAHRDEFCISAAETAKMTNNPVAAKMRQRSRSKSAQRKSVDAASSTPASPSEKTRKHSSKFAPLKDEFCISAAETAKMTNSPAAAKMRQRSRSKSSPSKSSDAASSTPAGCTPEKTRKHSSKFAPLKDEFCISAAETAKMTNNPAAAKMRHRSRSKSVQRKSLDAASAKLKKWPSDEKILLKRTNMRSQNSEFVQKQKEFLNRVIHQQEERQPDDEAMERDGAGDDAEAAVDEQAEPKHLLDEHEFNNTSANDSANVAMTAADGGSSSLFCSFGDASLLHQHHRLSRMSSTGGHDGSLTTDCAGSTFSTDADSLEARMNVVWQPPPKRGWDSFCWKCRECLDLIPCSKCVRCFHTTCIKINAATKLDHTWICPECIVIENVLNGPKRIRRNDVSLDILNQLLSFALKRMKNVKGYLKSIFSHEHPSNHSKYIVNPVTFAILHEKIENKVFRCAEEFVNETKWMLHNALVLTIGTTANSKDVLTARGILKICRQEANEIDTCPECYLNANTRTDWFVDVCTQPHLLLWAKLKGFPYWPAKAMGPGTQGANTHVNVRFFGEHDRAFVPVKDCFLYSVQDPNTQTGKRSARELADCIKEVELHIAKIKAKVGEFRHAPFKTGYDPVEELQQLEQMMPGVGDYIKRGSPKPSLQYKIVKTADNHLSIIKKAATTAEADSDSNHASVAVAALASPSIKRTDSGDLGATGASDAAITKSTKLSASIGSSNTKYEVITKASNTDESNCSKVSTVILKRKADGAGSGNGAEDANAAANTSGDDIELPLPKMTKIEECSAAAGGKEQLEQQQKQQKRTQTADAATTSSNKRKHGIESVSSPAVPSKESAVDSDKLPRSKHAKQELPPQPRVPAITIKTNGTKVVSVAAAAAETKESNTNEVSLQPPPSSQPAATAAQNAMQQLVKHKQGVTIKKITKDGGGVQKSGEGAKTAPPLAAAVAATTAEVAVATTAPAAAITTTKVSEKNKQAQNVTNILKDLVPFVEVKKEPTSDDEDEKAVEPTPTPAPPITTSGEPAKVANALVAKTDATAANLPTVATTAAKQPTEMMQAHPAVATAVEAIAATATDASLTAAPLLLPPVMPQPQLPPTETVLLTVVKQEVLSEDEEVAAALQINNSIGAAAALVEKAFAAVVVPAAPSDALVRVVGDTTIQRISTKQATGSQVQIAATGPALSSPSCTSTTAAAGGKRIVGNRGAPLFGPLSAAAAANTPNALHSSPPNSCAINAATSAACSLSAQQQQQLRQVHRARKSFPNRSPPAVSPVRAAVSNAAAAATQSLHVLSAGMAADLKRSLLKTTSMVSIPIHDIGVGGAAGSSGRNSIPVPPLTAVSKTTPTTTSAITTQAAAMATAAVSAAGAVAIAPTTFVNCNGGSAVMSSAPPPLAGLSQTSPSNVAAVLPTTTTTSTSSSAYHINNLPCELSPPLPPPSAQALPAQPPPPSELDGHLLGDFVTPTLASAITEVICRGPPKITVRPNGPLQSDGSAMFPSQAGPVCRTLVENAHKLTDFFISVMEDTMCEMSVGDDSVLQAKITLLTLELERTKQAYEHEIAELKRTSDLMLCEMRKSMENEKTRQANELRKQCELERMRSVEETKKKQWCANCGREAQFYCCWNTSYCDYPCQQLHWSRHAASCAQTRPAAAAICNDAGTAASSSVTAVAVVGGATAATAASSSSNTTAAALGGSQAERQHANKSSTLNTTTINSHNSSATVTATAHYNKSAIGHKKEKLGCGTSSKSTMSTPAATATAEVLKLPSNTYLRAVPPAGGVSNSNVRSSSSSAYSMQMPVQRFNIPMKVTNKKQIELLVAIMEENPLLARGFTKSKTLTKDDFQKEWDSIAVKLNGAGPPERDGEGWQRLPITAPVNTGGPPYTIVQRGTSWQLMSTATSSANVATTTMSTVAVPLATAAPAVHQQTRLAANTPSTKNHTGGGARQRTTGAAAVFSSSQQQHGGSMLRGSQM